MRKGDRFEFPCGAVVEIVVLDKPLEHYEGLVGVQVKTGGYDLTLSLDGETAMKQVELRFRPSNIDQLITILSELRKEYLRS